MLAMFGMMTNTTYCSNLCWGRWEYMCGMFAPISLYVYVWDPAYYRYPSYYADNTFHYQSDGWFSSRWVFALAIILPAYDYCMRGGSDRQSCKRNMPGCIPML